MKFITNADGSRPFIGRFYPILTRCCDQPVRLSFGSLTIVEEGVHNGSNVETSRRELGTLCDVSHTSSF